MIYIVIFCIAFSVGFVVGRMKMEFVETVESEEPERLDDADYELPAFLRKGTSRK